jgi:protein-S-isoprenylcysteine O-methyltransferase Ste14
VLAGVLALVGLGSLVAYLVDPERIAWASVRFSSWLRWGGGGVAGAGFVLLQWAQLTLGANWSDTPQITKKPGAGYNRTLSLGPPSGLRCVPADLRFPAPDRGKLVPGRGLIAMVAIDIQGQIKFEEENMLAHFGETYMGYQDQTGGLFPRYYA